MLYIISGIVIFLIIAAILIFLYGTAIYNSMVRKKNDVSNAWSQIKVQLNRRYDLIPNLVNAVKGYMNHEKETLEKVIQARNMAANSTSVKENIQNENMLTGALKSLFMVMENYPDLKANQNVMELQEELVSTENRISYARQHYNDSVMFYNNTLQVFPNNVIAGFFRFEKSDFFQIEDKNIEKAPEVKL